METRDHGRTGIKTAATPDKEPAVAGRLAERILHRLEEAGHRLTEPRVHLVRAVAAWEQRPFTGEDLYEGLRGTGLGRATVFRTLRLLQELGVLARLHLADGCQRYILTPAAGGCDVGHHDRLICRECGRVAYLEECPMEDSLDRIARATGYRVDGHHLDIVGVCAECSAGR